MKRTGNKTSLLKITYAILSVFIIIGIAVGGYFAYQALATPQELEKTSLRLKWVNQAQFAGYYMAKENNHYKDAGLEVTIDPAGPNISPTQMVVSGTNDFGIAGADEILQAKAKGIPVVALAVMFKQNPEALTTLKSSGIVTPKDLIGKRIGVIYGNDENLYREFLRLQGIDASQITEVAAIPGVSQLLSGQVDALMAYSMNIPVLLKIQGHETNVLKFSDYGVNFYGDTLFTTEKMIEEHPETVRKFVQASIDGWNDAIDQPESAIEKVMAINPALNKEAQLGYLNGVIPLLKKDGSIGSSDSKIWSDMFTTLRNQNVIKNDIDLQTVYTNQFIK